MDQAERVREEAAEMLRRLVLLIDAGTLVADEVTRAYLVGAMNAFTVNGRIE